MRRLRRLYTIQAVTSANRAGTVASKIIANSASLIDDPTLVHHALRPFVQAGLMQKNRLSANKGDRVSYASSDGLRDLVTKLVGGMCMLDCMPTFLRSTQTNGQQELVGEVGQSFFMDSMKKSGGLKNPRLETVNVAMRRLLNEHPDGLTATATYELLGRQIGYGSYQSWIATLGETRRRLKDRTGFDGVRGSSGEENIYFVRE